MKKLLILILIALLLALVFIIGFNGVGIGNLQILGIQEIQNKSAELDEKIQEAGKLAQKDFKQATDDVENTAKELESVRKEYLGMLPQNAEDGTQVLPTLKRYEIETLWVKIGNHATSEGTVIKMDVVQGGTGIETPDINTTTGTDTLGTNTTVETNNSNLDYSYYDLKFTVNGSYIAITDFISDIENDDELGFKIEEFKMTPSGSDLQATFTCKDILIKKVEQTTTTAQDTTNTTNNTNSTNSTNNTANNTNSTNNTNTANTTNTTNTDNTTD